MRSSFRTSRTCVFRVGGTITLSGGRVFEINNPYLTIAGQTAPGGGILITGHTSIDILTHDVIIRYLRIRLDGIGSLGGGQFIMGVHNGAYNVIVDHCSTSWTVDESLVIFIKESPPSPDMTNITVQRCFIAEPLVKGHGLLLSGQGPTDADKNLPSDVYLKIHEISIHHNLFAHNFDRNPRVGTAGTQIINNVVYNWGSRVGVSVRKNTLDLINNYWKAGPMSQNVIFKHEDKFFTTGAVYPNADIYIVGNIVVGNGVVTSLSDPGGDNWPLMKKDPPSGGVLSLVHRRYTPLSQAPNPITIQSATDAYNSVLADAGASARLDCQGKWVSNSDSVDLRIINHVTSGTGWSSLPASPGGFPSIASGTACADTDHDGMPDEWESAHGFNPANPADALLDANGDGYTNLEEYLNGM